MPDTQLEEDWYRPMGLPRRQSPRLQNEDGQKGETSSGAVSGKAEGAGKSSLYPLRAYPIPQNNGQATFAYTHAPFSTADLLNWQRSLPRLRDTPAAGAGTFRTIVSAHLPTWADVNQLLDTPH